MWTPSSLGCDFCILQKAAFCSLNKGCTESDVFFTSVSTSLEVLTTVLAETQVVAWPPSSSITALTSGRSKGGCQGHTPPPLSQNFFIFMHFSGKIRQIVGWCPPYGWHTSLWEILDPPLLTTRIIFSTLIWAQCMSRTPMNNCCHPLGVEAWLLQWLTGGCISKGLKLIVILVTKALMQVSNFHVDFQLLEVHWSRMHWSHHYTAVFSSFFLMILSIWMWTSTSPWQIRRIILAETKVSGSSCDRCWCHFNTVNTTKHGRGSQWAAKLGRRKCVKRKAQRR